MTTLKLINALKFGKFVIVHKTEFVGFLLKFQIFC